MGYIKKIPRPSSSFEVERTRFIPNLEFNIDFDEELKQFDVMVHQDSATGLYEAVFPENIITKIIHHNEPTEVSKPKKKVNHNIESI